MYTYLTPYKYVLQEVAISPTFDFRILLDAKLWKTIPKIRFSIYFSSPKKLTEIWPFSPKKVKITPMPKFLQFFLAVKSKWKIGFYGSFLILN